MSPEMTNGLFAAGGAVIGAIIIGGITLYQAHLSARRKELTIVSKHPTRLVELNQQFSQHVEVRVGGKIVPTVYVVDFSTLNSGNEVLQELEVPVTFEGDGEVIAVSVGESSFSPSGDDYRVEQRDPHSVNLHVKYLNPREQVSTRVLLSGRPRRFKNNFRQPGVRCRQRINLEGTDTGAIAEAIFSVIRRNPILHYYMRLTLPAYRHYIREVKHDKPAQQLIEPER